MKLHSMAAQLAAHPFVRDMPPQMLDFLGGCASNAMYAEGEFLFQEGHDAKSFYLLREGRVSLEIQLSGNRATTIETLGPGDVIGWSWLVSPYRWHFDARATETTKVYQLDGVCLRDKCDGDHDLGYEIMKRVLHVVQERLERVRMQLLDVYR